MVKSTPPRPSCALLNFNLIALKVTECTAPSFEFTVLSRIPTASLRLIQNSPGLGRVPGCPEIYSGQLQRRITQGQCRFFLVRESRTGSAYFRPGSQRIIARAIFLAAERVRFEIYSTRDNDRVCVLRRAASKEEREKRANLYDSDRGWIEIRQVTLGRRRAR